MSFMMHAGHFNEPHGGVRFGLGHLEVRKYLEAIHEPLDHRCCLQSSGRQNYWSERELQWPAVY